jgi:phage terminase small subunit
VSLTGKQQAFVNAYLGPANFNATEAARLAGYAGNDATLAAVGYENLRKPQIAEAINIRLTESSMSSHEVLKRLGEQARSEYSKYLSSDGSVNLDELIDDNKGHLIKGVKHTKYGLQIEFYDSQAALITLAKHHGLLTDTLKIKVENELNSALDLLEKSLDQEIYERIIAIFAEAGQE